MGIELIVFDLGGTLFEYVDMPLSWIDYYKTAFEYVSDKLSLNMSDEAIEKSVEVMRLFNPRINPREIDYDPSFIFMNAFNGWGIADIDTAIELFFESFHLKTKIYDDSISTLKALKEKGILVCALTDVPCGMPDELYKKGISDLLPYFDDYLSSCSLGYRKPNAYGIDLLEAKYGLASKEILLIGDEPKDFDTANNANCYFILIDRNGKQPNTITNLYPILELVEDKE